MKNKIVKHYNIHNILTFQIICEDEHDYFPDFNFPLSYFEVEHVNKPSIILNIGSFEPNHEGSDIVFKKCHVKKNYIYCREQKGLAIWQVEFIGIEDEITIVNFDWERRALKAFVAPYNFPQIMYLEPLIEYKLAKMGYCLLHAAAISKDGDAILLAGRSGSSKTPLIAYSINELGCSYIGDDKVILKDGFVYSYPRYINLFNYMTKGSYSKELGGFLEKLKAALFIMSPPWMEKGLSAPKLEFNINKMTKIKSINLVYKSKDIAVSKMVIPYKNKLGLVVSLVYNNYAELWVNNLLIDCFKAYAYNFPEILQPYNFRNLYQNIHGAVNADTKINEVIINNISDDLVSDLISECNEEFRS